MCEKRRLISCSVSVVRFISIGAIYFFKRHMNGAAVKLKLNFKILLLDALCIPSTFCHQLQNACVIGSDLNICKTEMESERRSVSTTSHSWSSEHLYVYQKHQRIEKWNFESRKVKQQQNNGDKRNHEFFPFVVVVVVAMAVTMVCVYILD